MPTGQVFRWHTRIMMQPLAISGPVLNPNSSAPSNAAIATSRPVFNLTIRLDHHPATRSPFITSVCCVSARPSSQGRPQCLIDVNGDAPVPAAISGDQNVIGLGLGDARGDRADTDLADQLHADARLTGIHIF